jgi:HEAT repeat protein
VLSDARQRTELVVKALAGKDEPLRATAIRLVRETKDPQLTRECMQQWKSLGPDAQVLLIDALADYGDRDSVPDILEACKSQNASVRIAGIKAIGTMGDAANAPWLAEIASRSQGEERTAARQSLRVLHGKDIHAGMIAQLHGESGAIQVELIDALADRRAVEGTPVLLQTAGGSDASVRMASYRALRELAGASEIEPLVAMLLHAKHAEQEQLENTIVGVARRTKVITESSKQVLAGLESVGDSQLKCTMIRILGQLGDASALPALRAALNDADPQIRYAAIQSLSAWPTPAPQADLLKIAQSSTLRTHKVLALRGFIDLIGLSSESDANKLNAYQQAMNLADQPAEKKRTLAKLSQLLTPESLDWAVSYLTNPDLKQEAAQAVIAISRSAHLRGKDKTIVSLRAVLNADVVTDLKQQAQQILDSASAMADYIVDWQISAPYTKEGMDHSQLFNQLFPPEDSSLGRAAWESISAGTDPARPFIIDILKRFPGDSRVGYVRTSVWSDVDRACQLWIGSDDGVKVWLNGQVVHSANVPRAITPDSDKFNVKLNQGWNSLMLKITQNNMPWEFCVRFRNNDGLSIPTLRFDPSQFR